MRAVGAIGAPKRAALLTLGHNFLPMSGQVKKRGPKRAKDKETTVEVPVAAGSAPSSRPASAAPAAPAPAPAPAGSLRSHAVACAAITLIAAYLRFTKIAYPPKVVFDEVHFGKFASYYLEGSYFFDLHPPFAKLLIALVGYVRGYDGAFKFDNIGDNYADHPAVPYVAYRMLLAVQGTLVVPLVYGTLLLLAFLVPLCLVAAAIVAFDNAHVIDSRLILLDLTLLLAVALTIYSYVQFSTHRRQPFLARWWGWLYATGVSLSLVISTKYVGVFTYVTIGIGVLHELWILLDIRRAVLVGDLARHFVARAWALIAVPFAIYLFWFYLHFAILTRSGPGDLFMLAEFQELLLESPLAREAKPVYYYDHLTVTHRDTDAFLHLHPDTYPLRYEDGRILSQGQQVTCVYDKAMREVDDPNNWWELVPSAPLAPDARHKVFTEDVVRLRHVQTGNYLLAHDVALPLKATHEEFTAVAPEVAQDRFNETLFKLKYTDATLPTSTKRTQIKTRATQFKVIHVNTVVAMWLHDDEHLPAWGFHHHEVSGNKKVQDKDNAWQFSDIVNLADTDERLHYVPKEVRKIPFLKKWWELQFLMFHHNNQLSLDHPFASQPDSWPLAVSGVSFWNDNDLKRQIFFVGNVVGFWLEVATLAVYVGLLLADQVLRRRGIYILNPQARSRLYNTLGFFFAGWAAHYLPFFLMNRQKFLHHYLPAHLIGAIFTGALLEFVCSNNTAVLRRRQGSQQWKLAVLVAAAIAGMAWFFWYFRAITYGDITLLPQEVVKRQWLDIKLHYSK